MTTNIPTIFIIFGATGDLMRRKLVPALFHLWIKKKLPGHFRVVGVARRPFTRETFQESIASILLEQGLPLEEFVSFLDLFSYQRADFTRGGDYDELARTLKGVDDEWGVCSNKLFYLAVSPELYEGIFKHLSSSGLTAPCSSEEGWTPLETRLRLEKELRGDSGWGEKKYGEISQESLTGWTRVIVEKPFGKDAATARGLDELLGRLFKEVQIYRIDHYLAKEMLQNILAFRFSNNLLEKNWSREGIEKIEIKVWESLGVEKRGAFYDGVGALRDVGQNHLLQMLALVTMDLPVGLPAAAVRSVRSQLLQTLKIPARKNIQTSIRAQYEGYRAIEGVRPDSTTETYFKIGAELAHPRWAGVPVMLESGKRLGKQLKEIVVTFKHPAFCLCQGQTHQNKVVFRLEPEEEIKIHFWSKKPGLDLEMEERTFEFLLRDAAKKVQYVEEYEKLLLDCVVGDQTLFVSTDEVKAMWRFIDPIAAAWEKNMVPLRNYTRDTNGIVELPAMEIKEKKKAGRKEVAVVGLGKMGMNIASRLAGLGWHVVGFDLDGEKRRLAAELGIQVVDDLAAISAHLHPTHKSFMCGIHSPRLVWMMIPAGTAVDLALNELASVLHRGDIVIDGGNSHYLDSVRRGNRLEKLGIRFLDVGASGGPEGAKHGLALMVGGKKNTFERAEYLLRDIAVPSAYEHVGETGAGHFVKMVHNGIEYGMMQSLAEGFALLRKSRYRFSLPKAAELFNNGSVIESRLVGWLKEALEIFGSELNGISGSVVHSGEGQWTVETARKLKVPVRVIEYALKFRKDSGRKPSYTGKILTALRNRFGGHTTK